MIDVTGRTGTTCDRFAGAKCDWLQSVAGLVVSSQGSPQAWPRLHFPIDQRRRGSYIYPMPYCWSDTPAPDEEELRLWPHESLPPRGYAGFLLATFLLASIPLYPLLGTVLLWGLLPFMLLALGGIWYALDRNHRDAQLLEVLRLTPEEISLTRHNPDGKDQMWACNAFWARLTLHPQGGPVPNYVTLSGGGREVEIGAFLSEDERKALYQDLLRHLPRQAG